MLEDDRPAPAEDEGAADEPAPTRPDQTIADIDPTVEADLVDPTRPGPGDSDGARPDMFDALDEPESGRQAQGEPEVSGPEADRPALDDPENQRDAIGSS